MTDFHISPLIRTRTSTTTPFSITTSKTKATSFLKRPQRSVEQMYQDMKNKLSQMQNQFKSNRMSQQRQLLKTYVKILEKIGGEVLEAKQKYLNLDKQSLKADKRLQIAEVFNIQRQKCENLSKNLSIVRQKINKVRQQNQWIVNDIQSLQIVQQKKQVMEKDQKWNYRKNKIMVTEGKYQEAKNTLMTDKFYLRKKTPKDEKSKSKNKSLNQNLEKKLKGNEIFSFKSTQIETQSKYSSQQVPFRYLGSRRRNKNLKIEQISSNTIAY